MRFLRYIFLLVLFGLVFSKTDNTYWRRGIVCFQRPAGWNDAVQKIRKLPQPYRRHRAISLFQITNRQSLNIFRSRIEQAGLSNEIKIRNGLWLGNGAQILYRSDFDLNKISNLDCVNFAFEDIEGFKISNTSADADILDTAWGVSRIGAPSCWSGGFSGQNIIVAVLDSGVRYTHHDLIANMWHNPGEIAGNGVDDDGNGYVDDYYGYDFYNGDSDPMDDNASIYHGTHCAGTVAGDGTSGTQTGVAPDAKIMAIKVMGSGGTGTASALVNGIQYAIENGASVLSLSLGWPNPDNSIKNYMRPVMEDVLTAGVVAAVAAGNEGDDGISAPQCIDCPGDCPSPWARPGEGINRTGVVTVGATGYTESIASFSSFGPTSWNTGDYSDYTYPPGLMKPDICAPGVSITSTYGGGDDGYSVNSGTSMAAPHLAGALAVILSKNPALTPEELDSLVQTTALELGDAGKDSLYGSGRLRLYNALVAAPEPNYPIIGYSSNRIDDTDWGNGNLIIDPGESIKLFVSLENTGLDATGVEATISTDELGVSITDNSGVYGSIGRGETVEDSLDPFILDISSSIMPGENIPIHIEITDDSGNVWNDTFEITVSNYPHRVEDIANGTVTFTVSNFGEVGFFDPRNSSAGGSGFVYGGYNYLYGGGFFLGFGYDDVSTGENGNNSEFSPITSVDIYSPGSAADKEAYSSFIDQNTRIRIDFKALAWNSSSRANFVILRYILRNITDSTLSNIYTGFYLDFDIHNESGTWYDKAFWNDSENWGYMWDNSSPPSHPAYVGLAVLQPSTRGSIVNNPTYVYPSGMGWADSVKYNFISGAFHSTTATSADDWSLIGAAGPVDISPGVADTFVYAIVAGDDSADFAANVDTARAHLFEVLSAENGDYIKPSALSLDVYPNPFNSSVKIIVSDGRGLACQTLSNIKVYDLRGNVVYCRRGLPTSNTPNTSNTSIDNSSENRHREMSPTEYQFIWLPDKSVSSGIYFVRARAENGKSIMKKILYIK